MRIHDIALGPYPARVRIALAEKNMHSLVEFVPVDLLRGEHKSMDFRNKNYSGTLPVLELEDGTFIAECTAITQYFDTLDGSPSLTGTTPLEQGLIHMMTKRAEMELLDAISFYFHHATPGLGPDVEVFQSHEWGFYQRDRALKAMGYFDAILRTQPFVVGDTFSMADIAVIAGLIFAGYVDLPLPIECDALTKWYAEIQERPSVKYRVSMSDTKMVSI